jgi:hypothetical protein
MITPEAKRFQGGAEDKTSVCGCSGGAPSAIGASAAVTRSGGKVTMTSVPMRSFDLSAKVPPWAV